MGVPAVNTHAYVVNVGTTRTLGAARIIEGSLDETLCPLLFHSRCDSRSLIARAICLSCAGVSGQKQARS